MTRDVSRRVVDVATTIAGHRYRYEDEDELQAGIAQVLDQAGIWYRREFIFSKADKIDFLLNDGIGIEVKIKGSPSAVARQLMRYACRPEVPALILVTDRSQLARQPPELAGKPLTVVSLLGGLR